MRAPITALPVPAAEQRRQVADFSCFCTSTFAVRKDGETAERSPNGLRRHEPLKT
jgi:hypothetical protein